MREKLREIISH